MKFKYEKFDEKGIIKDSVTVDSALELIKCLFLMNKKDIIKSLQEKK